MDCHIPQPLVPMLLEARSLSRRFLVACCLVPVISLAVSDVLAVDGTARPLPASMLASVEPQAQVPDGTAVTRSARTEDLKFREMFRLPLGAGGLEPSPKLLRLDGRPARIVGYMVDQEPMRSFILAPLPLKLGDEDESFADDLPPGVVFVHFIAQQDRVSRHIPGLLELTGTLSVGNFAETDGRVSTVRLTVDPATSQEMSHHVRPQ